MSRLESLHAWFAIHQRPLPWRTPVPDPYRIWISEVMSQQSVIETVVRYFTRWMEVFPRLEDLGAADDSRVLELWAGLGYYSRARLVSKTARQLADRLAAGLSYPRTAAEWMTLPGVGPYTAKAIASIAFGEPVLPLDGNLIRVVARVYGIPDPLNSAVDLAQVKKRVLDFEAELAAMPHLSPGAVAQAFMDLGATVCRPRAAARCELCPLREAGCEAYRSGRVALIPASKSRPAPVFLDLVALPRFDESGRVWVEPLPAGSPGNLIGQWQIPLAAIHENSPEWAERARVRHSITNHRFRVRIAAELPPTHAWSAEGRWVDPEIPGVHLTTLTRKILQSVFE